MLRRVRGYLLRYDGDAPAASRLLEQEGYAQLSGVFTPAEVSAMAEEFDAVFARYPRDGRAEGIRDPEEDEDFRYEMFNRSPLAQQAIARPEILAVIEPLLGADCHVIANTCWRNPPRTEHGHGGGRWHIDAGPHVPHDPEIPWDDRIPYPVFAIGTHIFLRDCPLECGPTGVIPGSHKCGVPPPPDRLDDVDLTCNGIGVKPLIAKAGDVCLFVSDVWHRRLPTLRGDSGRYFLQVHYARRDIAQRVRTTAEVNHVSADALERARSDRGRRLIGLHPALFYDG